MLLVIAIVFDKVDFDDEPVLFVEANTFILSQGTQHLHYREHLQQRKDRLPHNNNNDTLPTSSTQASYCYEYYDDEQPNKEELVRHLQSHPPRIQYEPYHLSEHF
jgi:hypothetical protein